MGVQNFILKPIFYGLIQDKDIADPLIHFISVFVLLFSYYFLFSLYGRREIKELSTEYLARELFGGFVFGFLTISLSIFILYLLGCYQFVEISTANYPIKLFTTLVVAALIEDLFNRGLILRELENWLGTHIALAILMIIETSSHFFNPNSNLFSLLIYLCWGFTMSMFFIYTKRIWLPFFFHIGWNFAQPFYGSNLTGLNNMGTIIQSRFEGPTILTGGAIGIEGSIVTVLFLLSIGLLLYCRAKKEGKIIKKINVKSEISKSTIVQNYLQKLKPNR